MECIRCDLNRSLAIQPEIERENDHFKIQIVNLAIYTTYVGHENRWFISRYMKSVLPSPQLEL